MAKKPRSGASTTVIFNPQRDELMTSGYDGKLWIWSIKKRSLLAAAPITGAPVISLAVTGDGRLLAALCSGDASIKLLDLAPGRRSGGCREPHTRLDRSRSAMTGASWQRVEAILRYAFGEDATTGGGYELFVFPLGTCDAHLHRYG